MVTIPPLQSVPWVDENRRLSPAAEGIIRGIFDALGAPGPVTILSGDALAAATDTQIARYDGTDKIQGSSVTIDDSGNIDTPGDVDYVGEIEAYETTVDQSLLSGGGAVAVLPGVSGRQYKVRDIFLSGAGTNFSGGDRNLDIKQGSTVYSTIPNATLGSLAASRWGDTGLPFPSSPSDLTTPTSVGQSIQAAYSGGTADHTAGACTIIILAERVT